MSVNPNEAPKGYVARPATQTCFGCDFLKEGDCTRRHSPGCEPEVRKDGQQVIFVTCVEQEDIGWWHAITPDGLLIRERTRSAFVAAIIDHKQ